MSFLRSKHSGWTWEGKRTPFGGGNPISGVTDAISNAIGTSGNGGLVSDISNLVEQGAEKVGDWGVGLDKQINKMTPLGWGLPAMIVAALVSGGAAAAGEGAAEAGAAGAAGEAGAGGTVGSLGSGGAFVPAAGSGASFAVTPGVAYTASGAVAGATAEGATAAGESAYNSAIANGMSQIDAVNAANQAAANYAYNLGGQGITSQSGQQAFFDALSNGSTSQEALNQGIAAQYSGQGLSAGEDLANIMKNYPNMSAQQLQDIMQINYGTDPMLSADAANLATSGYSPEAINQVLSYSYSPTELTGTGIDSMQATLPGATIQSQLGNVKKAYDVANLLRQGATSGLSSSIGQLAQGANPWGQQLTSIVRGNQNPFVYQPEQPIQNTNTNLVSLAQLLKQG